MNESLTIAALVGLSLGSFLNVCTYRIPRRISIVTPRSFCPHCKRQLEWFELVPIASYVIARGKCRTCLGKISTSYPLIELSVGLLLVAYFYRFGFSGEFTIVTVFSLVMLLVAAIDWKYLIIPNRVLLTGIILGVILKFWFTPSTMTGACLAAALALTTVLAVRYFGNLFFKKETMGFGDVKLAALVGFFIGFQSFLVSLWIASIVGVLFGFSRQFLLKTPKEPKLPFGSFLAFTSVIVMLCQNAINQFLEQWLILMQ